MWVRIKKMILIILLVLAVIFSVCLSLYFFNRTVPLPLPKSPLYLDKNVPIEERIDNLLSYMTLEEKVGQMALVEKNSLLDEADSAKYGLGGLLSGAGAKPEVNTAEGWKAMTVDYQARAQTSRLGIPLLYGSDAIHGHAHVPGATVFPHAIALGAAGDAALVERVARATAREVSATGVNWNYAPNLDLPTDIRWGRTYEAFSDDPALTALLGAAYVRGFQNSSTSRVLATPKHFVGLGSMEWGTSKNKNFRIDQGVTPVDETQLQDTYLPPFKASIDAGALSIMVGLNTWGEKNTLITSHYLLTDVLKNQLGFKGFLVSDWYGVYERQQIDFFAMTKAINAGTDMVMLPFDYKTFTRDMIWANRLGFISTDRIDDAVRRILRAKFSLGLFDGERKNESLSIIGSVEQRALAEEAVARSLVLLKNSDGILPIKSATKSIFVAGSAADNMGRQAGAWTVEWQGVDGYPLLGGTSILTGIKAHVAPDVHIAYSSTADFPISEKADIGIAVVGEAPYAEGWGDREYPIIDPVDLETIKRLQKISDKVVVVIVSGRPLLMNNEIDSWDAVVAAWLPGSEGEGVADVLLGKRPFSGKLPLPWPRTSEQLPITTSGITADGTKVLFPRYFGLVK